MKNILIYSLFVFIFSFSSYAETEPKLFSFRHYPMVYATTSETEAQFNVLVPRNKGYIFRAVPEGARRGVTPIEAQDLEGPIQDRGNLLHEHALKIKFSGLKPATKYKLQIVEISPFGQEVVDERTFSTFDNSGEGLKFVTGSCMSDEMRYEDVRKKIAHNLLAQNPDLIVLSGDLVYVDSFDYVKRHTATEYDIWARYFNSFKTNPLFRSTHLIPTISTWDDHDTGVDNGSRITRTIADARKAFVTLFGGSSIPGFSETVGYGLIYRVVSLRGQHFILLDNRTYRNPEYTSLTQGRYEHLGLDQERWVLNQIQSKKGFFWLVSGDMWSSPLVTKLEKDKEVRLIEGFHADHPLQYRSMMDAIAAEKKPYALISGDIHFTQIIEMGPQHAGSSRHAPFPTVEIVSSPMFSIVFDGKPNEEVLWQDKERVVGVKEYNFVSVDTAAVSNGLSVNMTAIGVEGTPLFSYGTRIQTDPGFETNRRKILVAPGKDPQRFLKRLSENNGLTSALGDTPKVKVAFFDADSTLRISKSGTISANSPTDVVLLPGVADKIAELIAAGYFIAIVSNQEGVSHPHIAFEGNKTFEMKFQIAESALFYTKHLIEKANSSATVHYIDFAEYGKGDHYRKPNIGMGKHLERVFERYGYKLDWENSIMVGDSMYTTEEIDPRTGIKGDAHGNSDRGLAVNLGIRAIHPQIAFSWDDTERHAIVNSDAAALREHCERKAAARSTSSI